MNAQLHVSMVFSHKQRVLRGKHELHFGFQLLYTKNDTFSQMRYAALHNNGSLQNDSASEGSVLPTKPSTTNGGQGRYFRADCSDIKLTFPLI